LNSDKVETITASRTAIPIAKASYHSDWPKNERISITTRAKSKIIMIGGLILVSVHIVGTIVLGTLYKETGIALAYVFAAVAQSIFLLIMKRNSI